MDKLVSELGVRRFEEVAFAPGHNACPGCGSTTALRMTLNAVGDDAILFVPASCGSLYCGPSDTVSCRIPTIHTLLPEPFAEAEGLSHGLRLQGRSEKVVVWAGDGCCYDIGLGGLSGAASRGADLLVICNDNQGYQNTGGHASTATPPNANTRTGRRTEHGISAPRRKDLVEIMAAHGLPYVATASAAFPEDLDAKVRRAAAMDGFRFILLLTPCVTWGFDSRYSVKLARLAVETGYFPLYEIEGGKRYRVTYEPSMMPLEQFTRLQKRFYGADLDVVRSEIDDKWSDLRFKVSRTAAVAERVSRPQWAMF